MRLFNVYVYDEYPASEDGHVRLPYADEDVHDMKYFYHDNVHGAYRHAGENEYAQSHDGDDDVHAFPA